MARGIEHATRAHRPLVRLLDVESAPLTARPLYADGDPGPIVGALAQVPEVLRVTLPFIGTVLGPSSIPPRTKEVVVLRTSAVLACRYCVDAHTPVARDAGLTVGEVAALRTSPVGEVAEVFTDPFEQALLGWVDAVAAGGPGAVPDGPAEALAAVVEDHALVELTLLVGATMMLNRFCTALRLPTSPETITRLAQEGWS